MCSSSGDKYTEMQVNKTSKKNCVVLDNQQNVLKLSDGRHETSLMLQAIILIKFHNLDILNQVIQPVIIIQ